MSAIGAELPPHLLAKRKRKQEEEAENEAITSPGAKRSESPGDADKRRRVVGPAMPPAPLDERPDTEPAEATQRAEESDSDSDDDFGPALPSNGETDINEEVSHDAPPTAPEAASAAEKPQRDAWMTMAPDKDNLAARMDPTKQRARTFNTGKGARGPNVDGDDRSTWHETAEQKQKRLADEMMGVSTTPSAGPQRPSKEADTSKNGSSDEIRKRTDKARGPSLLDQHQGSKSREPDDDPSKRAFDREKDMGSGMKIGHAQRKEMLNKAANFSSKFSSGSYL